MSRLTFLILLTTAVCICSARLEQTTEYHLVDTHHRSDQFCLPDTTKCDPKSTCSNCCSSTVTINEKTNATSCGTGQCLKDGTPCVTDEGYLCHQCCNTAFDDHGRICGGTCTKSGTECIIHGEIKKANVSTCDFCCDDISFKNDDDVYECGCIEDGVSCIPGESCHACCNGAHENDGTTCGGKCKKSGESCTWNDYGASGNCTKNCCKETFYRSSTSDINHEKDTYQCGCIEDGISCIPGDTCFSCCNGAYDDKGSTCGGSCIPNETECTIGIDCHFCCTSADYWYSTGTMHCGTEPCYEDGESCIPGVTCTKCCTGGAYGKNDTICGGKCLPSGTECTVSGTCKNCCPYLNMQYGPPLVIGWNPHWNATKQSLVCGYELCWKDGTDCVPGYTCSNCCNPYYAEVTGICGKSDDANFDGTCIRKGTECNFFSSCNSCCEQPTKYNETLGTYTC